MFADSFSVLSIHCVARGLGASFLYKCPASRCGFLRQHGLLVRFLSPHVRHVAPIKSNLAAFVSMSSVLLYLQGVAFDFDFPF